MTTHAMTQATRANDGMKDALIVLGSSFLIVLFGQISIPLPFSPVPLATQSSFCLLLALLIGSRRATLAVLLFLVEGVCGLPVFSLGKSGLLHLMGPTGGYLMGALLGTYLAGAFYESRIEKGTKAAFISMGLGNLLVFFCGWCQLSLFLGSKGALLLGVVPFLLGDLLKLLIATQAKKLLSKVV